MPETFGRYELGELIGRGGMGEVFRAYDTERERWVALKLLPASLADDRSFTTRFRRESRLAAQLNEPHIIPIHDFGDVDGRLYLDMRLVEGEDLGTLIGRRGRLSPELAVDITAQVAAALDAAHQAELVHRDVKPSNVLLTGLTDDPNRMPFAYLVDFGIARSNSSQMTAVTDTAAGTIGTIGYMAPERIAGQPGDARSDVYALGCMLYEALTGSQPFGGESFAVMFAHINTPPPTAAAHVPGLPPALDAVVRRAMAKSPSDRFQTAGHCASAALAALRDGSGAHAFRSPHIVNRAAPLSPAAGPAPGTSPPGPRQSGPQQSGPQRSGPQQSGWPQGPQRSGPPQSGPRHAAPPQPGPEQFGPQRSAPRQSGPQRSGARQSGPRQLAPRRSGPQQYSGPQQSGPQQSGPRYSGPQQPGPRRSGSTRSSGPQRYPGPPRTAAPPAGFGPNAAYPATPSGPPPRRGRSGRAKVLIAAAAVVLVAGIVTVVLTVTGGGSPKPHASDTASVPDNPATAATARSKLRPGGQITWALNDAITDFNYWDENGHSIAVQTVLGGLLPQPFRFSANGTATVDTDYFSAITETSMNPLTITYTINPKAVWSDGTHLSYQDFAGMWHALSGQNLDYHAAYVDGYDEISSVLKGKTNEQAVVTFTRPYLDWKALFAPLLPATLTNNAATFNSGWTQEPQVTSGPFQWDSDDSSDNDYVVTRNRSWWGDRAELAKIVFSVVNDESTEIADIGDGNADYADITFGDTRSYVAAAAKVRGASVRIAPADQFRFLVLNTKNAVLKNQAVRQAVLLGLDRAKIASSLMSGITGFTPAAQDNHVFVNSQPGYRATCATLCVQNVGQAQALITKAGYQLTNGYFRNGGSVLRLSLVIPAATGNAAKEAALIAAQLKQVGIQVTVQKVAGPTFFPNYLDKGAYQLALETLGTGPFPVAFNNPYPAFSTDPTDQSFGGGGSADISNLLDQATATLTPSVADAAVDQASALMWQQAAWIPLYQRAQATVVRSDLANIGAKGFGSIDWADIGFTK